MDFKDKYEKLIKAVNALYDAGHWTCDRDVDEQTLWEAVRDAMGRKPGGAPRPLKETEE